MTTTTPRRDLRHDLPETPWDGVTPGAWRWPHGYEPVTVPVRLREHRDTIGGATLTLACSHLAADAQCPTLHTPARSFWDTARLAGWVARPLLRDLHGGHLWHPPLTQLPAEAQQFPPTWWARICPRHAASTLTASVDPDGHLRLDPVDETG